MERFTDFFVSKSRRGGNWGTGGGGRYEQGRGGGGMGMRRGVGLEGVSFVQGVGGFSVELRSSGFFQMDGRMNR